jgi:enoyl-CoA hydratase/carnithine racemase
VLRLVRPARRNALDRALRAALRRALEGLAGDTRAVVVTGCEGSFCAGLDLKEREADKAAGREDSAGAEWIDLAMAIREHPAVFITAVNGPALGAGVTLLNVCDLALAASDATIGCPELGFAAYAGMSGPTTQLSQIPRKRVAWMLLTAAPLDAATAERWGLVNEVVAPDALLTRAGEIAAQVARFDSVALAEAKKALDQVPTIVTGWRDAMAYGQTVSAAIRERSRAAAESPARPSQGAAGA